MTSLFFLLSLIVPAEAGEDERTLVKLFNGKDLSGWTLVPESAKETFAVREVDKEPCLVVAGKPLAYLHTAKEFKDFVLRLDWKMSKDARSGVLLHIAPPHKIWPQSIQAQLQENDHGRLLPFGGAEGKFAVDKAALKKAVKAGEWNSLEIEVRAGKYTCKLNGTEVSSGTSDLKEGAVGLQSEGGEVLFKNVRIKVLR